MAQELTWTCACGAVEARLPGDGIRLKCYCASCRAHAERLCAGDRLDASGGSDLLQVAANHVTFSRGQDNLAWFRVTKRGPLRWFTTCCHTPMANTVPTRQLPLTSFQAHDMSPQTSLPEISACVNLAGATGPVHGGTQHRRRVIARVIARVLWARLSGAWRINPFFGPDGKPVGPGRAPPQN